jgi:hypothetical protein
MAALKDHKSVGQTFSNDIEYVRVSWDHALDGGATGVLDVFTAAQDIVVKSFHAVVKTPAASSGSATLIVGVSGGDTDAFMTTANGAVANLTPAKVVVPFPATAMNVALPAGGKIIQTIGTEVMSAGKIEYVFGIMKM